ncbi:MAG: 50S ribosomal protein L4, partial [Gemmatimonadetes bacterium]|nr:50S ribosomal protein L4 [Gemmatimonadota bacterium]
RALVALFEALELDAGNVLILTDGVKGDVYLSARNVPDVEVRPWGEASAYDVLWSDIVIVEETAFSEDSEAGEDEETS